MTKMYCHFLLSLCLYTIIDVIECQSYGGQTFQTKSNIPGRALLGVIDEDDEIAFLEQTRFARNAPHETQIGFPLSNEPSLLLICHYVQQQFGQDKPTDQIFRRLCEQALQEKLKSLKANANTNVQQTSNANVQGRDLLDLKVRDLLSSQVQKKQSEKRRDEQLEREIYERSLQADEDELLENSLKQRIQFRQMNVDLFGRDLQAVTEHEHDKELLRQIEERHKQRAADDILGDLLFKRRLLREQEEISSRGWKIVD